MITRAQAEALLTLAESLEACERLDIHVQVGFDGSVTLNGSSMGIHDAYDIGAVEGMSIRLAVTSLAPKSEPITAELLKRLRERSGEGMMSCKRALQLHHGDFDGALEHLRCEGQAVVRRPGALQPCGCKVRP